MENDNKDTIERDETSDIVDRDVASAGLSRVALIFVAFSIVFAIHSIHSIFRFLSDDSIPLVNCPRSYELDAPIILKPVREEEAKVKDRWIRGFIRRFVISQFPRVEKDVKPFFEYAMNHSKGDVKDKYESLVKDAEEIAYVIRAGSHYRFYPKQGEDSQMRIRSTDDPNIYIVEVDGYLVKKMNHIQERYTPTLRYVVQMGKPTMTNPEGLYVIEANTEQITDYVSGTKEKL